MDEIAKKCSIKTPSDWGNLTTHQVQRLGATSMLSRYYRGSLFACLSSIYKGFKFDK